ncbi:ParB N-terminal domain-containing protein [uncultured Olegusella sp.]
MEIIYKKLDELTPYANNPRNNDGKAVEQVAASIEEFGFKVPLVIDEGG